MDFEEQGQEQGLGQGQEQELEQGQEQELEQGQEQGQFEGNKYRLDWESGLQDKQEDFPYEYKKVGRKKRKKKLSNKMRISIRKLEGKIKNLKERLSNQIKKEKLTPKKKKKLTITQRKRINKQIKILKKKLSKRGGRNCIERWN